ncbi:Transposase [Mycoavidus cysteinexigens]|uniref:Transposase n=1 Tax=Mycoavidus cysteinexigens TaxID=1553431 RepID=A0A2Z6EWS7_9BURK|nr:hypothetical protein [Mycoavidus cysteinexigens]BBE09838.1 Transposase [Mycoavidus cysteinexigens]GAM53818.1 hypothetical protein EBME_2281 [bacterium endosymbiont of Mortierella elongata FMR23-6]GLR02286.1 hypothetical protein GCM10007934_21020 [Mycoavidus cysteinexigens]
MAAPDTITMKMQEVDRLKVIQAVVDGLLMPWKAAEWLDLSRQQIERSCGLNGKFRQKWLV